MGARAYRNNHPGIVDPRHSTLEGEKFISLEIDEEELDSLEENMETEELPGRYSEASEILENNECYNTFSTSETNLVDYWSFGGHENDDKVYADIPLWEEADDIPTIATHESHKDEIYHWIVWQEESETYYSRTEPLNEVFDDRGDLDIF